MNADKLIDEATSNFSEESVIVGQRVETYFNQRLRLFSVRDMETRRVILHCSEIFLTHVDFYVSESGRKRFLSDKRKNVHAFIRGRWAKRPEGWTADKTVIYNPCKFETFVTLPNHYRIDFAYEIYMSRHINEAGIYMPIMRI